MLIEFCWGATELVLHFAANSGNKCTLLIFFVLHSRPKEENLHCQRRLAGTGLAESSGSLQNVQFHWHWAVLLDNSQRASLAYKTCLKGITLLFLTEKTLPIVALRKEPIKLWPCESPKFVASAKQRPCLTRFILFRSVKEKTHANIIATQGHITSYVAVVCLMFQWEYTNFLKAVIPHSF